MEGIVNSQAEINNKGRSAWKGRKEVDLGLTGLSAR